MKNAKRIIDSRVSCIFIIVIFTFIVHFLFIFNQGIYWDSWIYYFHIITNNFSVFQHPWNENGRPLQGLIVWFIGHNLSTTFHIGIILAFRLVTVLCIAISGILVFLILQEFLNLDIVTSMSMALLGIISPAYQVNLSFATSLFSLCLPFYLGSLYLALLQVNLSYNVFLKIIIRILSLVLLLFSFIAEATIPLILVILISVFFYQNEDCCFKKNIVIKLIKFLLQYSDYIIITIIYIIIMQKFMHPYGGYSGARVLLFNIPRIMLLYCLYIGVAFNFINFNPFHTTVPGWHTFHGAWYNNWLIINYVIILFFLILISSLCLIKLKKTNLLLEDKINRKLLCLILIGIIAIILVGLPFVLGNRLPYFTGWRLRFSVLAAFPVAIVLLAFLKFLLRLLKWDKGKNFFIIVFCIISLSTLSLWRDYLSWQGRWALDRSAIMHFSQNALVKQAPIIFISNMYARVFNEGYRFYALSFMLNTIWPQGFTKIVIPHSPYTCSKYINVSSVRPSLVSHGGKILLNSKIKDAVIVKMYNMDNINSDDYWKLGLKYLYKDIMFESDFNHWLKKLVILKVEPYRDWSNYSCN